MEITNFLTKSFISSFAGTLLAVELIVFITKNFPLIKKIPTKFYTFILTLMHLIIVQVSDGSIKIDVENIYILFLNALVVELILCGGYDTIMNKFKNISNTLTNAEEDITDIDNKLNNDSNPNNIVEDSKINYEEKK